MIHRTVPRRAERLAICRLLVELARAFHKRTFTDGQGGKPFGAEIDIVFVAACVAIGDFEGRLMTASNVAHYIDMPRATAQRKLDELTERGIIEHKDHKYRLSPFAVARGADFVAIADRVIAKAQPQK